MYRISENTIGKTLLDCHEDTCTGGQSPDNAMCMMYIGHAAVPTTLNSLIELPKSAIGDNFTM